MLATWHSSHKLERIDGYTPAPRDRVAPKHVVSRSVVSSDDELALAIQRNGLGSSFVEIMINALIIIPANVNA